MYSIDYWERNGDVSPENKEMTYLDTGLVYILHINCTFVQALRPIGGVEL